jgi:hypothetical protein
LVLAYQFADEKAEALQRLADLVEHILHEDYLRTKPHNLAVGE